MITPTSGTNKLLSITVLTSAAVTMMACGLLTSTPAHAVETGQPVPASDTPAVVGLSPTVISAMTPLLPTNTAVPLPPDELNRIRFAPGGTWAEVGTYLEEGASITYVLSAMKYQVMSVSIAQMGLDTLEVSSAAGLLTDPAISKPFWRGTLPATQDYFIKVSAYKAGDFKMRVAVNPPGNAYQYFEYRNQDYSASFNYSDEFAPVLPYPVTLYSKTTPSLVLYLINPDFYRRTNLFEARVVYGETDDNESVAACLQPILPIETMNGQESINGYQFTVSERADVGAGNLYNQLYYRTVYNNSCYEFILYLHSGNINNYDLGTVVEFDREIIVHKFKEILATFTVQ